MITADPNLAVFRLRDKAGVKAGKMNFPLFIIAHYLDA